MTDPEPLADEELDALEDHAERCAENVYCQECGFDRAAPDVLRLVAEVRRHRETMPSKVTEISPPAGSVICRCGREDVVKLSQRFGERPHVTHGDGSSHPV